MPGTERWRRDAACRGHPEAWIFDATHRADRDVLEQAGRVCKQCPVQLECGLWAATEPGFEGVAAGWVWRSGGDGFALRWAPCLAV